MWGVKVHVHCFYHKFTLSSAYRQHHVSDDVEKAELSKARPLHIKREQLRSGFKMPQAYTILGCNRNECSCHGNVIVGGGKQNKLKNAFFS